MNNDEFDEIDPKVIKAAEELRQAYKKLQQTQDPPGKEIERQNVIEVLKRAVVTTTAVETRDKTKPLKKSRN